MPVLDLLPFLPPGLSPSPVLALLPTLLGVLALLGLLLFVVGVRPLKDVLHAWRQPTHSVLPTTDPASNSARSTAHPGPSTTLRGRGRARSKPGRRGLFGIGLNLGRRAKSLGPVLPRFNPASQRGGATAGGTRGRGSAPASPGLRVPLLAGDADAVPLVDLSGSWGSFSFSSVSLEDASGSGANSGSGTLHMESAEYPDGGKGKSPAPAHEVLIDVSHSLDEEDRDYELVDVSVPPSPAAWALAHPIQPASPAANSFLVNSDASTSMSTSTTRRLPEAMTIRVPLANTKGKDAEPHQLPSPPQSPPPPTARRAFQAPVFPAAAAATVDRRFSAWNGDPSREESEETPSTARPRRAEHGEEGEVELVQLEAPVTLAVEAEAEEEDEAEKEEEEEPLLSPVVAVLPGQEAEQGAGLDVEVEAPSNLELELPPRPTAEELAPALLVDEEVQLPTATAIDVVVGGMRTLLPAADAPSPVPEPLVAEPAPELPLPTAYAIDAVEGMHTSPLPLVDEPAPELPLPTANAIDAVVEGMHALEDVAAADSPVPVPLVDEPAPELPLPTANAIDAVVGGMHTSPLPLVDEPAPELPLPTAHAIDAVVGGMHALEDVDADAPEPEPLVDEPAPELPLPTANAIDAVVEGMHALEDVAAAPAPAYDELPGPVGAFALEAVALSVAPPVEAGEVEAEAGEVQVAGGEAEVDVLPSARAIDVLVEEMHARASESESASTLAPPAGVEATPSLPAYSPGRYADADVGPRTLVPSRSTLFPRAAATADSNAADTDPSEEDGDEGWEGQEEWAGEGAWDGEVRPLEEVVAAFAEANARADAEAQGAVVEEDPGEMALPSMPLPLPQSQSVSRALDGEGIVDSAENGPEETEDEADPEDLPLPSMPMSTSARWTPPAGFSAADLWGAPPPPADDGDVEELVLDGGVEERDEEEGESEEAEVESEEEDVGEGEDGEEESALLPASTLHIDTASLGPEDEREQDLASSTLSTLSSSEGVEAEGTRVLLRSASPVLLLRPESRATPRPDSRSTATSDAYEDADEGDDEEEEIDLGVVPARKPAWSRRAAAAPALGLPSSTRVEREEWVPGAFPASASFATTSFPPLSSSSSPSSPAAASPALSPSTSSSEKGSANKENTGAKAKSSAVETPKRAGLRHRSPLDAALAMQLRPGMGVGADGAWLVRFLMSFFGWFAVLVAGGREFN